MPLEDQRRYLPGVHSFAEVTVLDVFKRLTVQGAPQRLSELIARVTDNPAPGWQRNRDNEPPGKPKYRPGHEVVVFRWAGEPDAPASDLYVVGRGDTLEVTNIVPIEVPQLSRDQYNIILDKFALKNISSRAQKLSLKLDVTPSHLPITHWLSTDAAKLLEAFSRSVNRSILHPLDSERWRAFLIRSHLDRKTFDSETLFRWLTEEEGWPEDKAERLVLEFEFAAELLDDYDKKSQ